ncbi:diguanylate cyclase [Halomonas sp. TRM85114]|uniref:sensor domain-containing diguanylate cyclase n=1 Tax=Halomonas jincaotanensis TaxID=2810616 RepID=UPI001BD60A7C|nr:GGDEF domain-containing protein [Halomonas jincaotanensis]MBS9402511.1 diguanylate cyclase [Halomonas jincaotanensis]
MRSSLPPLLWALVFCLSISVPLQAGATTTDLESGWQYRWGDSPLDENGTLVWTQEAVDEAWQPIGFPSNPPGRDERQNAWFRITLPEGDWRDPVVYIFSVDLIVQVYLESDLIYQYGAFDQDGRGRFEGWPWHLIELPEDFGNSTLYFRVFSDYTDIGLWGEVKLMERPELFVYILERSAKALAISGFSLLIALLTFFFALLQTNRRSFAAIGLFSLASGLMILAESQASQLLFEAPLFWDTLAAGSYFLLPVALALLLEHWLEGRYSWVMRRLWQGHLLYAVLALGLSLSGVVDLSTTYPPFDALLVVSLIIMLGPVLVLFRHLSLEQKAIITASGFFSLLLIADMAVAHGLLSWRRIPVSLGALGFSLTMVIISLADYARTQREIQRLNRELKQEVAARTQELETLVDTLRDYSYQDPLTGLKNRRHFEELLVHESASARRERTPLALVMLDIDHFKQFNDRHGHETGDAVLASVGALLREHFRDADVVCRLGGEEFVVVLPGATAQRAEARVQALLFAIRGRRFRHLDTPLDEVTLSCGIAAYPQHTRDPSELVTLADQALYRAKHAGRDRSETYVASVAG